MQETVSRDKIQPDITEQVAAFLLIKQRRTLSHAGNYKVLLRVVV